MVALLIQLLIILLIVGALLYCINLVPGVPSWAKQIITVIAVVIVLIWALQVLLGSGDLTVDRVGDIGLINQYRFVA